MRTPKVDAYNFVRIWNSSKSIQIAAKKLGTTTRNATMRAAEYRQRRKVDLKRYGYKGPEIDWDRVRRIALEALG